MTKRILAILATLALLLCAMPLAAVSAESTFTWKVGTIGAVTEEGYQHVTEFRDGYYWLRSQDVRASVAGHNLDDGPYYMAIGQNGRIPTGHWLQVTVSNGERNPNWFGVGDIRIQFPNPNNGPLVIKSKATGKDYNGPVFMTNTAYVLKFAKEQENGVDVLAIYINGQKVFSGADELAIFNGDKIWFNTNCMYKDGLAANDSLGVAPIFLNPNLGDFQEPEYYFQSMTKGGKTSSALQYYVTDDLFTLYDENGYAHAVMDCTYDDAGGGGLVGESVATELTNSNQKFEITVNPYLMYSGNWNVLGVYNADKGILSPAQNGDMIRIAYNAGGKATVNYYYGTASGDYVSLIPTTAISWRNDQKFQFELVEGEVASINVSLNGELQKTIYESDENVAGFFDIMRAATLRIAQVGHKATTTEGADVYYLKVADDIVKEAPHEHVFEGATCSAPGVCACGEVGTELADHGNLVHFDAVEPGCHYEGNVEYWICYDCEGVWTDEALTQVSNIKNVVLPATGGDVVHVEALEPTCGENGNIEYWTCESCEKVWQDAALTQLTNRKNVVIAATGEHEYFNDCDPICMNCWQETRESGHEVQYAPEVIATDCQTMGNVEHWFCEKCGTAWLDEAQTQQTNLMWVKTGFGDHNYVDGACDLCGELDPDYAVAVESQTIGTVTYTVMQRADGTYKVVISGTGTVKAFTTTYAYDEVIIEEGITAIDKVVFQNNVNLKTVSLPESLESIGNKAFLGSGLTSVSIPDGVLLGEAVFMNCKSLDYATIGNITSLDANGAAKPWLPKQTFSGCNALTVVNFGEGITAIGNAAFAKAGFEWLYIPGNIRSVGNVAFNTCANLTTVELGEGVKTLAYQAFAACTKLTEVIFPASLQNLSKGTFTSCYGLESLVIPDTVIDIKTADLFFNNKALKTVTLPASTTTIDSRAFYKCVALESIEIPANVTTIGKHAFYNCRALTAITIPANVETIADAAFNYCKALDVVTIESAAVAAGIDSATAMGEITRYASVVILAEGVEASDYIVETFPNVETVDGYTVYSK
ncbi:MAG: leucine-rich repeat domain-containing protein [Clostridia bacterium]|nr:leucine-rich repeat domain-containing protein [Clostridia bacterium]